MSFAAVLIVSWGWHRDRHGRRVSLRIAPEHEVWPTKNDSGRRRVLLGLSPWVLLVTVLAAWEALGIDTGAHEAHLTISALAQAFRAIDAALMLIWMLAGLGYGATRARSPVASTSRRAEARRPGAASSGAAVVIASRPRLSAFALLLPDSRAVGVAFWISWVGMCVLADLAARHSRGHLATAEDSLRWISAPGLAKIALVGAWTFAGWHLFAY